MELFLRNGDYLPDGKGGFVRAAGGEELLQRALFKLTARRGGFPLLPELGSRFYELPRHKVSQWEILARQYAAEALADESDLTVTGVTVAAQGSAAAVEVALDYHGEALSVTVEI